MVKVKDPNGPKKPLTAYFAFTKQNRARIVKSMPVNYSFKQLAQAMSKEWKGLEEAEKTPFNETYKTEMERYKKLFNAYKLTANYKAFEKQKAASAVTDVKASKFKKDPNAPKKALSGYFMFLDAKRDIVKSSNPDLSHKECLKKLGAMWTEMSDTDKKVYQDKAATAKEAYEKVLDKYKKTAEYKSYQEEKAEWQQAKKSKLKLVKKRAAREDPDADWQSEDERPTKRAKRAKKKSPKKAKKKSKKSNKGKKSGKPKAPKKKTARKSLVSKKKSKSKKQRKTKKKATRA